MEPTEIKELFFTVIADARADKRDDAHERLTSSDDESVKKLAQAGRIIYKVISREAKPHTLEDAMRLFEAFPQTDYWHSFMETSGQVVLTKALSIKKADETRLQLLRYGLQMVGRASAPGFPLSDSTIELVKRARVADSALREAADRIVRENGSLVSRRRDAMDVFRGGGKADGAPKKRKGRQPT